MIKFSKILPGALVMVLLSSVAAVCAEGQNLTIPEDAAVRICEAYGPGYQAIPGTSTCIKTGGSVEVDATGASRPPPQK